MDGSAVGAEPINLEEAKSSLLLNAFWVNVSPSRFQAHVLDVQPARIEELRSQYEKEWHFRRPHDHVLAIKLSGDATLEYESRVETLDVENNLGLASSLVEAALPEHFDEEDIVSRSRKLTLKHGKNIARRVALDENFRAISGLIDVRPFFNISTRLINPAAKVPFIAVTVGVRTPYRLVAPLSEYQRGGANLRGMPVCRRDPSEEERRFVGTIDHLEGGMVVLAEKHSDVPEALPEDELQLEGRPEVVKGCLKAIIGGESYSRFNDRLEEELNSFRQGSHLLSYLGQIKNRLSPAIEISRSLVAEIKGLIGFRRTPEYTSYYRAAPLEYYYNPTRTRSDNIAFRGLDDYGPYSQSSFPKQSPTLLVVTPKNIQGTTEEFVSRFKHGIQNSYYEPGFDSIFRLKNTDFHFLTIPTGKEYDSSPGRAYKHALETYFRKQSTPPNQKFDAAIIALEDRFEDYRGEDSPYLQAKSFLLTNGVPTQQVLRSTMVDSRGLPNTLQNISTALYAKMGGVPWTVSQDESVVDELVVGLGIAELHEGRFGERERFVGITTVFEGNGNYLLSNLSQTCSYDDYPDELRRITLQLLRNQKGDRNWDPGNLIRLTFHTTYPVQKRYANEIIRKCVDEVASEQEIQFSFLSLSHKHPYVLLDRNNKDHQSSPFVPDRGTIARLSKRQTLLSPLGIFSLGSDEPMRRPLKLKLHDNSTFRDLFYLTEQVYKFTGISWKTVRPVKTPVTIEYSHLIAKQLKRLIKIPDFSPGMLNTALSSSKWFL